jgi:hypothetical protein
LGSGYIAAKAAIVVPCAPMRRLHFHHGSASGARHIRDNRHTLLEAGWAMNFARINAGRCSPNML